jgi:hypothetical protein
MLIATAVPAPAGSNAIGPWEISPVENACAVHKVELNGPRPSVLRILLHAGPRHLITIGNSGWSVRKGDEREVYMLAADEAFLHKAISFEDNSLTIAVEQDDIDRLIKGSDVTFFLKIDDDRQTVLEQFSLARSGAAIASGRDCVANLKDTVAQQERRSRHVPADPFAPQAR